METIIWLLLLAAIGVALFYAIRHVNRVEIARLHQRNQPLFQQTLAHQGVGAVEVLKDSTSLGNRGTNKTHWRPFQVHMILHSPPDRWFLYLHTEGSAPLLQPLTEERARLALNAGAP